MDADDAGELFSGYLEKQGVFFKRWTRRFYVLDKSVLLGYISHLRSDKPLFHVQMKDLVRLEQSQIGQRFVVTLVCKSRNYVVAAPTEVKAY